MSSRALWRYACGSLLALQVALPAAARAEGDHVHPAPLPPAPGDVRFMFGTTGPVVFRGTAATVTIPDGNGFGGERGRTQNSGDRRKNNYSVTDANFNNALGLLDRHPDTGQPLTYVQHIQTYAAAGFLEAYAPTAYARMLQQQNSGQGTILGAAAYLMGLVARPDAAASGVDPAQIPARLPGTDIDSRLYVRAGKDATGQSWARMHHAQTAPMVYRMLTSAGVNPTTALILASDDGISGAGRLNGMNEQDGSSDGYNSGERATWALAAQVALQTGIPVVTHMMHGHDHAGLDPSALTNPKINSKIGYSATDRSTTDARAAAVQRVLVDGTVATSATAAADQDLTVRNSAYLTNVTGLEVDMQWFDYMQSVGVEKQVRVTVTNDGPHVARDVMLDINSSTNLQVMSVDAPAGLHCSTAHCHVGDLPPDWTASKREFLMTVRFTAHGKSTLRVQLASSSRAKESNLVEQHDHAARTESRAAAALARGPRGWRAAPCGTRAGRPCTVIQRRGASILATVRPGRETTSGRWVKAVFYQRRGKRWARRFDRSGQVNADGRVRIGADRWSPLRRGAWRVQVQADATWLLGKAVSRPVYLNVR